MSLKCRICQIVMLIRFRRVDADCLAHFERLDARMTAIIARYELILDGRDQEDVNPLLAGVVIKGPWGRSPT